MFVYGDGTVALGSGSNAFAFLTGIDFRHA
jgi:hypothetical protein